MPQIRIPAVFMRGGTSKAVVFHERDLPAMRALWGEVLLAAIGSPDPFGRQLDGMGGGVSSLSKVCIVGPSSRPDADVDYTFAQVQVKQSTVDLGGNCGNMSSAMGPFAVDEGLVRAQGPNALVRIHNTNTRKVIHAHFGVTEGRADVDGTLVIPGVAGSGAPVRLEFLDPGGATTGTLLPTGRPVDRLAVPGVGQLDASMVDAANACVFVTADALGLRGDELPDAFDASRELLERLDAIRVAASVAMGIAPTPAEARRNRQVPFIAIVSGPLDAATVSGEPVRAHAVDLTARAISSGQPHRALPLTISLCLAVAARIEGSVVHRVTRPAADAAAPLRIGMPSGVLVVGAAVDRTDSGWRALRGEFYRTQRRLFEGNVLLRPSRIGAQTLAALAPGR